MERTKRQQTIAAEEAALEERRKRNQAEPDLLIAADAGNTLGEAAAELLRELEEVIDLLDQLEAMGTVEKDAGDAAPGSPD